MRREMVKMKDLFSNKGQNPLECKIILFFDEEFLENNIHLTKSSQIERLVRLRKQYKI